jgi:hypothetical protein
MRRTTWSWPAAARPRLPCPAAASSSPLRYYSQYWTPAPPAAMCRLRIRRRRGAGRRGIYVDVQPGDDAWLTTQQARRASQLLISAGLGSPGVPAPNPTIRLGCSQLQCRREPASSSVVTAATAATTLNHPWFHHRGCCSKRSPQDTWFVRRSPLSLALWSVVFSTDAIALICIAGLQIYHHRRCRHLRLALAAPVISLYLSLHALSETGSSLCQVICW